MGIQRKDLKAEVCNLSFKVDKEVKILSVLIHWGVALQCMQENPLSLFGQYNDDDGDENNTPLAVNGTKVLNINNATS